MLVLYPLAEGRKRVQPLLVLGGVAHHRVVAATGLQHESDMDRSEFLCKRSSETSSVTGLCDALGLRSSAGT